MRPPLPHRRWRRAPAVAVLALVAASTLVRADHPAAAQPPASVTSPQSPRGQGPVSTGDEHAGVAPELAGVEVRSDAVSRAEAAVRATEDGIAEAEGAQHAAEDRLAALEAERAAVTAARGVQQGALADAESRALAAQQDLVWLDGQLAAVQRFVDELVLASYIGDDDEGAGLQSPVVTPARRRATYTRALFEQKRDQRLALVAAHDEASGRLGQAAGDAEAARAAIAAADAQLATVEAATLEAGVAREHAVARQGELAYELRERRAELAEARRTGEVVGAGLRLVVLDALWKAVEVEGEWRPACALDLPLLLAISRVEGRHGTFGGATVDRDGHVVPRIVGPALDGVAFALITDTDGGVHDGDPVFDRAVGPMQFIPSSWALFGQDGNGDGVADPNNFYDAALAAAEHLCQGGWDVSTAEGRRAALFSYNQSDAYRLTVESWQRTYQALFADL